MSIGIYLNRPLFADDLDLMSIGICLLIGCLPASSHLAAGRRLIGHPREVLNDSRFNGD